jgi:hypothetical protein
VWNVDTNRAVAETYKLTVTDVALDAISDPYDESSGVLGVGDTRGSPVPASSV